MTRDERLAYYLREIRNVVRWGSIEQGEHNYDDPDELLKIVDDWAESALELLDASDES